MTARLDEHLSLLPNFDGRFDLSFNEQDPDCGIDPAILNQNWKTLANDSENARSISGGTGGFRNDSGSITGHHEQEINYLDMSLDDANFLPEMNCQLRSGNHLSNNPSESLNVAQSASKEDGIMDGPKTGYFRSPEKRTTPSRKPLVSRPFLTPVSYSSRPYRNNGSFKQTSVNGTSKKVNSILKRKMSLNKYLPLKLINHLQDEFQSNLTVSREFKRKSSEILGQLIELIDHEKLHGSLGAAIFLSQEEQIEDDRNSTCSTDMDFSFNNSSSGVSTSNSGYETHQATSASASMSAPSTQGHDLASRPTNTKTIYQCTYPECVKAFSSFHDWKRHEEIEKHWLQKRYMCLECDIANVDLESSISCAFCFVSLSSLEGAQGHVLQCQDAKANNKTFARKDKFRDHLRDEHMIPIILDYMDSWKFSVESNWPRQCGFCGAFFRDWEERAAHIETHYKKGANIAAWKLPFPVENDSAELNSFAGHRKDYDDDDDRYQEERGSQFHGQSFGGWLNNSSSYTRKGSLESPLSSAEKEHRHRNQAFGDGEPHEHRQTDHNAPIPGDQNDTYCDIDLASPTVAFRLRHASWKRKQCLKMRQDQGKLDKVFSPKDSARYSTILHNQNSIIKKCGNLARLPPPLTHRISSSNAGRASSSSLEMVENDSVHNSDEAKINELSPIFPSLGLHRSRQTGLDRLDKHALECENSLYGHIPQTRKSDDSKFIMWQNPYNFSEGGDYSSYPLQRLLRWRSNVHKKDYDENLDVGNYVKKGINIMMDGLELFAYVDSRAAINIISLDFAMRYRFDIKENEVDKGYISLSSGESFLTVGRVRVSCSLVSQSRSSLARRYQFHVLAECPQEVILGQSFMHDFDILRCLYKRPNIIVDEVRHKTSHASIVRKTISSISSDVAHEYRLLNEAIFLSDLKRWSMAHIVEFEGLYASEGSLSLLLSPAANCNLENYMAEIDKTFLPTRRRLDLLHWQSCLLSALSCLHKHKINHRNISPANILISDNKILLSGFGLATSDKFSAINLTGSKVEGADFSSASRYSAPEVACRTKSGLPADVFSMGCVLLEMSTIVNGTRMKYMAASLRNDPNSNAYHRNLKSLGKWIEKLSSESQSAMRVWEFVLGGRKNYREYVVALRRRLNVIRTMLSESPSNRPAATGLIPLFDTPSFLSVRDKISRACHCKHGAHEKDTSAPDSSWHFRDELTAESNISAATGLKSSLSALKLEFPQIQSLMPILARRTHGARRSASL